MQALIVNGSPQHLPDGEVIQLQDMLAYIRQHFSSPSSLIASISIDGREINIEGEPDIAHLPLSEVDLIEVRTQHPREIADDTLNTLPEFIESIERLSRRFSLTLKQRVPNQVEVEYRRLIDGISTLNEAIDNVKQIFRIGPSELPYPADLESELAKVLRRMHENLKAYRYNAVEEILDRELPDLLVLWRTQLVPMLRTARDS